MKKNIAYQKENFLEKFKKEYKKNKYIYFLAIPVVLYYLIFCYGPMSGIIIAFKQFEIAKGLEGIFIGKWVGFKYFIEFFTSMNFPRLMRNTFAISFYEIVFGFPTPIIFALLLNEIKNKPFMKTIQTVTYLPHFISLVVMCGIIADFFSANGVATRVLSFFGGELKNYLGDPQYFRSIFVGTNIWQGFGWGSIIYLAALTNIDPELYEAANIDGAGRFRQLLAITLPGISSTIIVMLILRLGQLLNVGFEKIILLYSPGTYETADVISSFVYRRGLGVSAQYSFTTAVGLFQSTINMAMLFTANFVCNKFLGGGLFK